VDALSREFSDHTPLLLNSGEENKSKSQTQPQFKFELGWLLCDDFFELVSEVWKKENKGGTPL